MTTFKPDEQAELDAYTAEIEAWRTEIGARLRAENGWLTLTGLYWLREGTNTVGSNPAADVLLPESAPPQVGVIELHNHTAVLHVSTGTEVAIEGVPTEDASAVLRNDYDPLGGTRVEIGAVNFNVIKRGDQYGVRVRDQNNPARQTFAGRRWFPVDSSYRVTATFTPHAQPCELTIATVIGTEIQMTSPGYVQFVLQGHSARLVAFSADEGELWFVFRDAGKETYQAGRFLYASLNNDGTLVIDFNKAYNPPCAFTPYATCPLPPKENVLPIRIEAGEKAQEHA